MNNKLNNVFFLMQSGNSAEVVDELKKKEGLLTPFLFIIIYKKVCKIIIRQIVLFFKTYFKKYQTNIAISA